MHKQTLLVAVSFLLFCGLMVWSGLTLAVDPENRTLTQQQQDIAQCKYIAGALGGIQQDRIDSGYTVEEMLAYYGKLYADDDGRAIVLSMTRHVYDAVISTHITAIEVQESAWAFCMKHKLPPEPEPAQTYEM